MTDPEEKGRVHGTSKGRRARYDILLSIPFTLLLLTLVGFGVAYVEYSNAYDPKPFADFLQTLNWDVQIWLAPERLERTLFVGLTLAAPICIVVGLSCARHARSVIEHSPFLQQNSGSLSTGAALVFGLLGVKCLSEGAGFYHFFPRTIPGQITTACLVGAALSLLGRWLQRPKRAYGRQNLAIRSWSALSISIAFIVAFLPRGLSIHSVTNDAFAPAAWWVHFQAAAFPLTQAYAGKPLLTAAPPLYGYYAEFLLPIFSLLGLSIFTFCLVMAGIQAIAMMSVAWTTARYIRIPGVLICCSVSLFYVIGGLWHFGKIPFDPYFQYFPIRFIFPALSGPVLLWALREKRWYHWCIVGIFVGCALCWNFESGIAVTGAILFVLAADIVAERIRQSRTGFSNDSWLKQLQPILAVVALTALSAVAFWMLLGSQAQWKTPRHTSFEYLQLFSQAGFMMMPLPLTPHPWWVVVGIYITSLALGIHSLLAGRLNSVMRLMLHLSILGIGLFTYYQGRSHDYNLISVSWPSIILGFLLTDRLFRAIRTRLVSAQLRWLAIPAAYVAVSTALLSPPALLAMSRFGFEQWRGSLASLVRQEKNLVAEDVDFIRRHVGPDRECVIMAKFQAVYFAETGLRSAIDAPGMTEFFFKADWTETISALANTPVRHVFVDKDTLEKLNLLETSPVRYKIVQVSSSGMLLYLEPSPWMPPSNRGVSASMRLRYR